VNRGFAVLPLFTAEPATQLFEHTRTRQLVGFPACSSTRCRRRKTAELVQAIWDSVVAQSSTVPVTDEQRIELDRRLADAEANPSDERPWSEVRASLERSR
jgi:putative addiction module component (TIGR02574 family)